MLTVVNFTLRRTLRSGSIALISGGLILSACAAPIPEATMNPSDANGSLIESSTEVVPSPPPPTGDLSASTAARDNASAGPSPTAGVNTHPRALMELTLGPIGDFSEAVLEMSNSGNVGFVPVLVDLLRFRTSFEANSELASALVKLTQGTESAEVQPRHLAWDWWVIWLGENPEIKAVEGYAGWKGRLFAFVDEEMGELIYQGVPARIRLEEVVWGGVPKDGIPDLTNPPVVSSDNAQYLNPEDRVFGVSFNGEHRAYPLRILNPHEMANDVVGGIPFALAY